MTFSIPSTSKRGAQGGGHVGRLVSYIPHSFGLLGFDVTGSFRTCHRSLWS